MEEIKAIPKKVVANLEEQVKEPPKEKNFKEVYEDYYATNIQGIKDALEANFPDRWEFKPNDTKLKSLYAYYEGKKTLTESTVRSHAETDECYDIMIHFPKLDVKNSKGAHTVVTDLYIKVKLTSKLRGTLSSYFYGCRMTFSLAQYMSNYDFSHLASGGLGTTFQQFCLGSTHFATLCADLRSEFNMDKFELFCIQLGDYLQWESLEGGPYKHMRDISERGDLMNRNNIPNNIITGTYLKFLEENFEFDVQLLGNSVYHYYKVIDNDKLLMNVTQAVTHANGLEPYDPIKKSRFNNRLSNRRGYIDTEIASRSRAPFSFKGQPVKFDITDKGEENKVEDKTVKVAAEAIVTYVRSQLESEINQYSKRIK